MCLVSWHLCSVFSKFALRVNQGLVSSHSGSVFIDLSLGVSVY